MSHAFGFHVIISSFTGLLDAVSSGDLDINISTSPRLDIMDIDATEHGGEYDCIVSNDAGIGRATAILYIEPYFTLHPVNASAKHGETATFTCMAESFPYPSYQWQKRQGSMFTDMLNETDVTLAINVGDDLDGVYRCVAMSIILGNTISITSNEATLYGEFINGNDFISLAREISNIFKDISHKVACFVLYLSTFSFLLSTFFVQLTTTFKTTPIK